MQTTKDKSAQFKSDAFRHTQPMQLITEDARHMSNIKHMRVELLHEFLISILLFVTSERLITSIRRDAFFIYNTRHAIIVTYDDFGNLRIVDSIY